MIKKGDTLIEVTLAVGIFSMIAIAVVAVMSNGTSDAQTALETTLAREEIDTQAEALRFIQSSAVSTSDPDNSFVKLWESIISRAITIGENGEDTSDVFQYTPTTCTELYDTSDPTKGTYSNLFGQNAFVINPRALGDDDSRGNALVAAVGTGGAYNAEQFQESTIYPRIIFGQSEDENEDKANLDAAAAFNDIYRAEGIYIVAVKDNSTTAIVDKSGEVNNKAAFYDFYIRTCWYGSNADRPSTISTVIRLLDSITRD